MVFSVTLEKIKILEIVLCAGQLLLTADEMIRASQKPIRDSSSIRNAAAISAGVVSMV